jgi:hypothetical protein
LIAGQFWMSLLTEEINLVTIYVITLRFN